MRKTIQPLSWHIEQKPQRCRGDRRFEGIYTSIRQKTFVRFVPKTSHFSGRSASQSATSKPLAFSMRTVHWMWISLLPFQLNTAMTLPRRNRLRQSANHSISQHANSLITPINAQINYNYNRKLNFAVKRMSYSAL